MKVAFGENPKMNYAGQGISPTTRMAIAGMLRQELTKATQYVEQRGKVPYDFHYESWVLSSEERFL